MTTIAPPVATPAPTLGRADPDWRIEPLWESDDTPSGTQVRGGTLPPDLEARFGARMAIPLRADRPTIVANFVSTIDGIVALDRVGASGGREISGAFEPDRFMMGLLRAMADAVVIGAGTVRASRTHGWSPGRAHPDSSPAFRAWRRSLGLPTAGPTTVIVSASGSLEPDHLPTDPDVPVIVVTTAVGARRLETLPRPHHVEIAAVAEAGDVPAQALVDLLRERRFRLVLSEGGPTLFGTLLAAGSVDELFLTVAPQLAGRSDRAGRLGLVEGAGFARELAPWARLRSVLRSTDHLFLRYLLPTPDGKDAS